MVLDCFLLNVSHFASSHPTGMGDHGLEHRHVEPYWAHQVWHGQGVIYAQLPVLTSQSSLERKTQQLEEELLIPRILFPTLTSARLLRSKFSNADFLTLILCGPRLPDHFTLKVFLGCWVLWILQKEDRNLSWENVIVLESLSTWAILKSCKTYWIGWNRTWHIHLDMATLKLQDWKSSGDIFTFRSLHS